jgi:hypothetical protein
VERGYLLSAEIGIEDADFVAVRSLALDPVVGPAVRDVNHVVCQRLTLKPFRERVVLPEFRALS